MPEDKVEERKSETAKQNSEAAKTAVKVKVDPELAQKNKKFYAKFDKVEERVVELVKSDNKRKQKRLIIRYFGGGPGKKPVRKQTIGNLKKK